MLHGLWLALLFVLGLFLGVRAAEERGVGGVAGLAYGLLGGVLAVVAWYVLLFLLKLVVYVVLGLVVLALVAVVLGKLL